jgi:cell division protein FtsZ
MQNAEIGIAELREVVDTLITIPNDRLLEVVQKATLVDALRVADDVLRQGIQGISDLIAVPSMINLDFADVRSIMKEKGMAHMGIGTASGDNRAVEAARQAVESPLLETRINGAKGVLMNITGGTDLGLLEVNEAAALIQATADPDANIIWGAGIDEELGDSIRITVIATGFESESSRLTRPASSAQQQQQQQQQQPSPRIPVKADGVRQGQSTIPLRPQQGEPIVWGEQQSQLRPEYVSPVPENGESMVSQPFTRPIQNRVSMPEDTERGPKANLDVPTFLRNREN